MRGQTPERFARSFSTGFDQCAPIGGFKKSVKRRFIQGLVRPDLGDLGFANHHRLLDPGQLLGRDDALCAQLFEVVGFLVNRRRFFEISEEALVN